MLKSTQEAAQEAWDELEGGAVVETPVEPEAAPVVEAAPVAEEAAPEVPVEGDDGPARGPDGKFAKKAAETAEPGKTAPALKVVPGAPIVPVVDPAVPDLKPPADWRAGAREKWATLPREVQQEALRLHVETKKVLQDSAIARQTAEGFQRTVAPYEHMFRAAGKTPIEGVNYLVQTYAQLQTAPLPQRAGIIGGMIRDFLGTDENAINLLGSVLEGKATPAGAQPSGAMRPEQIAQMMRQEYARLAAEQSQQGEAKAIDDFKASAPEFLGDVENETTALAAMEKRQGKPITVELLKACYEKALRLNPQTVAILKQRDDAKAAQAKIAAQNRKAAAAGIKSEPAGTGGQQRPKSTKDAAAEAYDELSSR